MSEESMDFDAEFQDLVSDLEDMATDSPLHLAGGSLSVGLVLAPVPSPHALFSLLSLSGLKHHIIRLKPWSAVWVPVEASAGEEDEFASLFAEERQMPDEVDRVAQAVSRLSKFGAVAVMSWLVEGQGHEPGVSGHITARRYVGGKAEEAIPAGLLLGDLPQAAEDLLLGRTRPQDYSDSIAPDGSRQGPPKGPFKWLRP